MKRYEPPAGATVQAYRFALDPSDAQVLGLRRNTGAARFAYNHMLRRVCAVQAQRAAEASYGVAGLVAAGPDAVAGLVPAGPATHLERDQAVGGAMVGGMFQGGVQHWPGQPVRGTG